MRKIDVMKNEPYFSIIVPMYNAARYIKICIDSILNQTFQDFEVIIIDDVSTDDSYNICRELYGGNKKVRLLRHEKNLGQGPARNTGIKNARGKYIGFVDNDDAIIPTALEKVHKATNFNSVEVDAIHITGHFETFQDDDKPIDLTKLTISFENRSTSFLDSNIVKRLQEHFTINRIWFMTWTDFYKRDFLVSNEIYFDDIFAEDALVHFKVLCLAKSYFMFRDLIHINRQRKDSLSRKTNVISCTKSIKSMPIILSEMKKTMALFPVLSENNVLQEQCILQVFETLFRDHARPLYNGVNIPQELDQAVYDTLLPIFGENTILVKYLFHGFNTMWRQANILATQNYLLRQRDELIKQQNKILEQMNLLLSQQSEQLQHD